MKILVYLGHPAHFHLYKNVIQNLKKDGHEVDVLIKKKDNLEQLLQNSGIPYHNILREGRKDTKIGMAFGALKRMWRELVFCIKHKPDLLTGTSVENSYVGPLLRIPVVYCGEDDASVIPLQAKICYPGASVVLTPEGCDDGKWNGSTTKYPSYHELAYLHPNHFTPSADIVREQGINPDKPYAIMRFVKLKANHDDHIKGINKEVAIRLIEMMKPHMDIYITSERPLEPELEPYRIKINPIYMHDVMAFASLYIGDSQTMAMEAAVLGVPAVRFNDFVGKIGVMAELEDGNLNDQKIPCYNLGIGIKASEPGSVERLLDVVREIAEMPAAERKALYQKRRERMLADKIDYARFLTWFIENYPASAKETKKADADFWKKFK